MIFNKIAYLLLGTFFICCDSAFVDTLEKCDITDENCVMKQYMKSLDRIGPTGIPELGIPPIEPLLINDMTISGFQLLDLTLIQTTAKGITHCEYSKYKVDLQKKRASTDISCDSFILEGRYKLASGPLLKSLLGDVVHGEGNGKLVLEKIHLTYDFGFTIKKDDKGIIHYKPDIADIKYTFEVLQKATLEADNVYLGSQEISKIVTTFFNENWQQIIKSFSSLFSDKAINLYFDYISRFFGSADAKDYITNDLTPYLDN